MQTTIRAIPLAMVFSVVAFVHAEDGNDTAAKALTNEAAATAQAEMEAARAQMEAARIEMQEAGRRLAEASRRHMAWWGRNRAFLGVLIGEQSKDGIVVAGVTPAGGAEAAGVEVEDVIVAINGKSLTGHDHPVDTLYRVLEDVSPGGNVKLAVSRNGNIETYDVGTTPTFIHIEGRGLQRALEIPSATAPVLPSRTWHGLMTSRGATGQLHLVDIGEDLGDYFGVDGGVLVLNAPGKSELKPGDILRRIDGADVGSADEAYRLLATASSDDAEVEVRRKNRKVDVPVAKLATLTHRTLRTLP